MAEQAAAAERVTFEAIAKRIVRESGGVDITTMPFGDHCVWFGTDETAVSNQDGSVTTTRTPTLFKVGHPILMCRTLSVLHIFGDEGEFRVYGVPNEHASKTDPSEHVLRVYHLSRTSPTYLVKNLPLDAFVMLVASEWSVEADAMVPIDKVREGIAHYLRAQAAGSQCPSTYDLADAIEDGSYAEDAEDEPETPETPEPPASPAGGLPS